MRFVILLGLALLVGSIGGLAAHRIAEATHVRYDAWITPSAGSPNSNVKLECGWHPTACPGSSGPDALDWSSSSTTVVYLRGGFKRQYTSGVSGNYLYGWRFGAVINNQNYCEEAVVDVKEPGTNKIWFGLHMMHVWSNFQPNAFTIWVSSGSTGYFGHYLITHYMTVTDEGLYCTWRGPHVHDFVAPMNIDMGTYQRAPQIPLAPQSLPSVPNGDWMRYFSWQGS